MERDLELIFKALDGRATIEEMDELYDMGFEVTINNGKIDRVAKRRN